MHVDSVSFGESAAMGILNGVTLFSKMGSASPVNEIEVDLWALATPYVFPAAAQQMEVISSSAADAPGQTGVFTVKIWYLTSAFVEKTEIITLNGVTGVLTAATDIYRINAFWVMTAGTGLKAAGTIDIRNKTTTTTIYSRIGVGQTRARNAMYTVPAKKVLYIKQVAYASTSATSKASQFTLRSNYNRNEDTVGTLLYPYSDIGVQDSTLIAVYEVPDKYPAGSDIKVSVIATAGAACICSCQLRGWLIQVA
jgi:hypothetical protein